MRCLFEMEIAKVTPLLKTDDSEIVNTYRPISGFSAWSESLLKSRLNSRLFAIELIICEKGIYVPPVKPHKSNSVKKCVLVSLDLCKTFDTVDYMILNNFEQ